MCRNIAYIVDIKLNYQTLISVSSLCVFICPAIWWLNASLWGVCQSWFCYWYHIWRSYSRFFWTTLFFKASNNGLLNSVWLFMLLCCYFVLIALNLMTCSIIGFDLFPVCDGAIPRYMDSLEKKLQLPIIFFFFWLDIVLFIYFVYIVD